MFESNLQTAKQQLMQVSVLRTQARKLPNPGKLTRFFQPVLYSRDSEESDGDRQKKIDTVRKGLEEEAEKALAQAAGQLKPVVNWLVEQGIARDKLVERMTRTLGGYPTEANVQRLILELNGLHQVLSTGQDLKTKAGRAEASLRARAIKAANEQGCDLDLDIFFGDGNDEGGKDEQ